jgi:hypothetical protein
VEVCVAAVVAAAMVVPAVVTTAGMRTERKAGEEDHGDDEDHSCDDAHPGSDLGDAAGPTRGVSIGRRSAFHWAGCGFGRRRCFTHGSIMQVVLMCFA